MNTRPDTHSQPTGPFEAVNRRFLRLIGEEGGPLTKLWMIIAGYNLMVASLTAAIQIKTNAPMMHELFTNPAAFAQPQEPSLLPLLLYPLLFIGGALYWSSFRAVREVEERRGNLSFNEAKDWMFKRFVPVGLATIAFGFTTGVGMMFCIIPGLIAMYYFYFAPYLAAEGLPVGEAFRESMDRAKRHTGLLCLLIAISIVGGFGSSLVQFAAIGAFEGALGSTGILIGSMFAWAMASIVGYFFWIYSGSVFITVSKAEENLRPGLGAPFARRHS